MENTNLQIVQQCNEIKILSEEEKNRTNLTLLELFPKKIMQFWYRRQEFLSPEIFSISG